MAQKNDEGYSDFNEEQVERKTEEEKQDKYFETKLCNNAMKITITALLIYLAITLTWKINGFIWSVLMPVGIISSSWLLALPLAFRSLHKSQKNELRNEA